MTSSRWARPAALVIGLGAAAALGQGREPRSIGLEVAGCSQRFSRAELRDAVGVELRGVDADVAAFIDQARPRASVWCEDESATLEVFTGAELAFREDVRLERLGLARFIAIAIVEGITARAQGSTSVPASPQAAVELRAVAEGTWLRALAGGALNARSVWGSGEVSVGLSGQLGRPFSWAVLVSGSYGRLQVAQGRLDSGTASVLAALRLGSSVGRLRVDGGLGARVGLVVWEGTSSDPSLRGVRNAAAWAGPALVGAVALAVSPRVRVELELEAAWLALGSRALAGDDRVAELGPLRFGARLGVAFAL